MEITKLIKKLQDVADKYHAEHGKYPEIFSVDEDEGTTLCFKIEKNGCLRTAKKPYLKVRTGLERFK